MAYNNGFPVGYQQYYQPYQPQPVQMPSQQSGVIWVQGEAAAKSYLVAPNTTVALFDSEEQTIYMKSLDATGMPSMKILDYTIRESPRQAHQNGLREDFATKEDISTLKAEIERIKEDLGYGKPIVSVDESK